MTKFQVGDRVAVYGHALCGYSRTVGIVKVVHESFVALQEPWLDIDTKDHQGIGADPKQCRKLVKKARRRVFVLRDELDNPDFNFTAAKAKLEPQLNKVNWVEFVEVRRKK